MNRTAHHPLLAGSLALCSGFVDVVCLVRYGVFAALQTGNVVHIGIALGSERDPELLLATLAYCFAVLASHFCAVVAFCAVAEGCSRPLLVAAPTLGLLTASGGAIDGWTDGGCKWAACCVAASFGAMNFSTSPNTVLEGRLFTMVSLATGNLQAMPARHPPHDRHHLRQPSCTWTPPQKSAKMLYKAARGHAFSEADLLGAQVAAAVVGGTFVGAALGGAAYAARPSDLPFMLIPAGLAQYVTLLWHDQILRPQASKVANAALVEPLRGSQGV